MPTPTPTPTPTNEKTSVLVHMSVLLKDAIGVAAQQQNMSVANLVRVAVAAYIGYDLAEDINTPLGRPRVYANKEERIRAQNERTRTARLTARALMEYAKHAEHVANREGLRQWLLAKGVSLDE